MTSSFKARLREAWNALLIDRRMVFQMFKGSVPVAISLAFYQSTAVSEVYTFLGFLVSIIAVVTVNVLPRAKLIEMTFNICLYTAIAIPITMLSTWSGIQARNHTDPQNLHQYNSSQSAITGIWLFSNILVSNSIQARYPALLIPTILYNIFVIVQYTSCSRFHTWEQCWSLIYLTTRCYYTGVAISFVSGLLIFPVTCRTEIFELQEHFFHIVRNMPDDCGEYLETLQANPTFPIGQTNPDLRATMANVKGTYVQIHRDLAMAKREVAWGKLSAKDIGHMSDLCRRILMPLSGMAHLPNILHQIQKDGGWAPFDYESRMNSAHAGTENPSSSRESDQHDRIWRTSIEALIDSARSVIAVTKDGVEHAGLQLEISQPAKKKSIYFFKANAAKANEIDVEADGQTIKPGNPRFSSLLEEKLSEFMERRAEALTVWANSEGVESHRLHDPVCHDADEETDESAGVHLHRDRKQLFLILYIQNMIYSTGVAVLNLSRFSDDMVANGTMSKNRLIVPSPRRVWKWFLSVYDATDTPSPDDDRPTLNDEKNPLWSTKNRIAYDIEHLPPQNAYERLGVKIRRFQSFLKGPELSFGFRSACATISCAIIAYLHQTQEIFTHYRLIWSVIISAIGANMSAGQSGVSYFLRILGSFAALIICYAVWYIPHGNVPGVIVVMWFVAFLQMYFLLRWPKYIIGWLVVFITEVLTIGYELQVRKIGVKAAESGGIYVFPPYYVAALRVACVLWGTRASMVFTYYPYPITARGLLRSQIAVNMELLANYHAVVHSTIKSRLHGTEGDANDKHSRGRVLSHTRKAMFNKIMFLNAQVLHNLYLQKYEPTLGGRFPVAVFQSITSQLSLLLDYVSLMSYATQVWSSNNQHESQHNHVGDRKWLMDLSRMIEPVNATELSVSSMFCQLSAAVSTGQSLPPRLDLPKAYHLSEKLSALDPSILSFQHVQETGYSAVAVMEIMSAMILRELEVLRTQVESLVGVVNFDKLDLILQES